MQDQNYKNHSRYIPVYHIGLFGLAFLIIAGSGIKLYRSYTTQLTGILVPIILLMIGVAILLLAWYARAFALRAQDRAIRSEENLRYFAITGKLLDNKLTMKQIIALRFAPNNELLDLSHRAVAENLTAPQIKEAIQHWKSDFDRV
ncbi:MAG: DUF6526 family protein [Ferruginibacter sp.]